MTRRTWTFLLALLLLASTTGCTSTESSDNTVADTTAPSTEAAIAETETEEKPDLPVINFEDRDFVIYLEGRLVNEFAEFYVEDEASGTVITDAAKKRNDKLEETYGVKLVTESNGKNNDVADVKNAIMAGTKAYDLVSAIGTYMSDLVLQGCVRDLNTLEYVDLSSSWYLPYVNDEIALLGKQYSATGYYDMATFARTSAVFFSTKLAEDYNLGNLYTLVNDNQWTYDTLCEMASTAAVDINGDGIMEGAVDQFGLTGGDNMNSMLITCTGYRFTTLTEDGYRVPTGYNDMLLSFNDLLMDIYESDWYFEHHVDDRNFGEDGKPVFMSDRALFLWQDVSNCKEFSAEMEGYGVLPIPKLSEAQQDYVSYCRPSTTGIPSDCSDTQCSAILLEALNYESKQYLLPAYVDSSLSARYASSAEAADTMKIIFANVACDFAQTYYTSIGVSPNLHNSVGSTREYVSYYEGVQSQLEANLKKICDTIKDLH